MKKHEYQNVVNIDKDLDNSLNNNVSKKKCLSEERYRNGIKPKWHVCIHTRTHNPAHSLTDSVSFA